MTTFFIRNMMNLCDDVICDICLGFNIFYKSISENFIAGNYSFSSYIWGGDTHILICEKCYKKLKNHEIIVIPDHIPRKQHKQYIILYIKRKIIKGI